MKKTYNADSGCIAIGNENFQAHYPNGYGDGSFKIELVQTNKEKDKFYKKMYEDYKFLGSIEGDCNVYCYDCLDDEELKDKKNILFKLSGRYQIHRHRDNGNIVIDKLS